MNDRRVDARWMAAVVIGVLLVSASVARADVKATEKSRVQFTGLMGRMVNMFGGRAAREGVETTVALKGQRKMSTFGESAQLIDLAGEKIYDIDLRHHTYRVTTFAELRAQMEKEGKRAQEQAAREQKGKSAPPKKEYDVDVTIKPTGQRKTINGFDCHEVIETIVAREKGKTLEQGGGLVLTDDMWLTPTVAAMQEITAFDVRYVQQLAGPYAAGVSPGQMAAAAAMFPGFAEAFHKLNVQGASALDGTPIASDLTVETVKSAEQLAEEKQRAAGEQSSSGGHFGGLFGGLSRKLEKKVEKKVEGGNSGQARTTVMTLHHEVLSVSTGVSDADVAIPAGFREKK